MLRQSILLSSPLFLFACIISDPAPGTVRASSYLPGINVLDYRADQSYLQPLENAPRSQVRAALDLQDWLDTRSQTRLDFESELAPDFDIPLAILEKANEVDLTVVDNQTLFANFPVEFQGDELDVELTVFINKNNSRSIEEEFVVNGIKRLTMSHDFFVTEAQATIFDGDEAPRFTTLFTRDENRLNLLIENVNNNNAFLIEATNDSLFIGREKNRDAEINEFLELRVSINTDDFAGRADFQFFGDRALCFGDSPQGQLGGLDCAEVEPKIEGIDENVAAF